MEMAARELESRIPYYTRKMQMVGGRNLSADHSHKVAKVVLVQGQRAFDGLYTVMNEFGKILAFNFVNGTNLREVEDALRGLDCRYELHGMVGPIFFTTDRCCDEREFFAGTRNAQERPIFRSFGTTASDTGTVIDGNALGLTMENNLYPVDMLTLPKNPCAPASLSLANITAGHIIQQCIQNQWQVIGYDSEWAISAAAKFRAKQPNRPETRHGPDVFTLCLPDGTRYDFELRLYNYEIPGNLKKNRTGRDSKSRMFNCGRQSKATRNQL